MPDRKPPPGQKPNPRQENAHTEQVQLEAVLVLVSDQINLLREQGRAYEEIAAIIERALGMKVTAEKVKTFHLAQRDWGYQA